MTNPGSDLTSLFIIPFADSQEVSSFPLLNRQTEEKQEELQPPPSAVMPSRQAAAGGTNLAQWNWPTKYGKAENTLPAVNTSLFPPSPTSELPAIVLESPSSATTLLPSLPHTAALSGDDIETKYIEKESLDLPTLPREPPWYTRVPVIRTLYFHFHPRFLLSILDVRSYFWPLRLRKILFMLFYAALIAGAVVLDHYLGVSQVILSALKVSAWPAMIFLICLDPVTAMYYSAIAPLRPLLPECSRPDWEHKEAYEEELAFQARQVEGEDIEAAGIPHLVDSNTQDVALVIPCHNSELDEFELVLAAALRIFRPENIFVVENGNSPRPPNHIFHDLVLSIEPRINYVWSPYGNKNIAEYVGALAAHRCKYICTIDDDVVLPVCIRSFLKRRRLCLS